MRLFGIYNPGVRSALKKELSDIWRRIEQWTDSNIKPEKI
jgi:hypothetical protein